MVHRDNSLYLISQLLHTLSHKIRTPLSVIGNDLYYIGTQTNLSETTRAQEKVYEIGEILTQVLKPIAIEGRIEKCSVRELFSHIHTIDDEWGKLLVAVNRDGIKAGISLLQELIDISIIGGGELGGVVKIEMTGSMKNMQGGGEFTLFTQLFNDILQLQTVIAPLVDALFSASCVQVHGIVAGQECNFQLQFCT